MDEDNLEEFVNISKNWFKKKVSKYQKIGSLVNICNYFENLNKFSNKKYKPKDISKEYLDLLSSSQITRLYNEYRKHYRLNNTRNKKGRKNLVDSINDSHYQFLELYEELMKHNDNDNTNIIQNDNNNNIQNDNSAIIPDNEPFEIADISRPKTEIIQHKEKQPEKTSHQIKTERIEEINNDNTEIDDDNNTDNDFDNNDNDDNNDNENDFDNNDNDDDNEISVPPVRDVTPEITENQVTPENNSPVESESESEDEEENENDFSPNNFEYRKLQEKTCDACDQNRKHVYHHKNKDIDICIQCLHKNTGRAHGNISTNLKKQMSREDWNTLKKYHQNKN